jgi:hypothetical protein
MSQAPIWFERKFEFSFPAELHLNVRARLRALRPDLKRRFAGVLARSGLRKRRESGRLRNTPGASEHADAHWHARVFIRYHEAMTEPDAHELPDDPNDSDALRDQLKGQTTQHAEPPRLEDEGQSGG